MALERKPQTAAPSFERRRPAPAAAQRSAASAPAPQRGLQERLGNHATQQLVSRSIQFSKATRLPSKVSKKTEAAEVEAEETARKVVRMREPAPAGKPPGPKPKTAGAVQRAEAAAAPAPAPRAVAATRSPLGGGAPLPAPVRSFMEPRFGASFSHVRVHTGDAAAQQSAHFHAKAFTAGEHVYFGRNQFQPDSSSGRELIAHELTHTIQQGATVQRSEDPAVTRRSEPRVQRFGISDALDWIAEKAYYIPGFRLLTIVLGVNPINWESVPANTENMLRAILELIPVVGRLAVQALDEYGIIKEVAEWADGKIAELGLVGSAIKQALDDFLDSLSWTDIFDLGDVYDRGKRIFTDPIDRLIALGESMISGILGFIQKAILVPLAVVAKGVTGNYDLLAAVLGKDPITGEKVEPDSGFVIGGFMKLIGFEDVWENAKKANAGERLWAWFKGALFGLIDLIGDIPGLFLDTLLSLEIIDLVLPWKAFAKVAGAFASFAGRFINWAFDTVWTLLEIIVEVVSPESLVYIKKTGAALKSILRDPVPFMKNLVRAAQLGFELFSQRFPTHLKKILLEWLLGALPGVYIPKSFAPAEVAKLAFSALGLTWDNIRQKLVKATSEKTVKTLETMVDFVALLATEGPAAAWDKIKEQLADLKEKVIDGIIDMVVDYVKFQAIPKLIGMFIPGAGFVLALIRIYDTVKVFINKLAEIGRVVKSFIDSIVAIAGGAVDVAAQRVETTLAGMLSLAISFLAGFAGLGSIPQKVKGVIERVRAPIDKALDWLVGWIVKAAKKTGTFVKEKAVALVEWWKEKFGFTNKAGETHTLQFIGSGDAAKLGIASTLMTAREYLDTHPDKGKPEWNAADAALTAVLPVIYSPARKTEDEKKRRQTIKDQLAKVSAALAKLGGEPPTAADYGKSTAPTYGNPAKVEVIVDQPLTGSATGPWPEDKPGYKEIADRGLTKVADKWVQMHIVSEKLGGSGTSLENLIPAPQSVNVGPFRTFEHATAKLASGKSGSIKNRVWVEVLVTGAKNAATAIAGKAGLYFWKGKKASPPWLKNEAPALSVNAGVPVPQLGPGPFKLVLNFTSGTDMQRDFGISATTAKLVKEGRPYASLADFSQSMAARGATAAQINAVLNRGAVLNGP